MMNSKLITLAIVAIFFISMIYPLPCHGIKPEIYHKFREPEKRPSIVVSTFFTLLVASPAILLFALWSKSVSLKLDSLSIKRIIFHTIFLAILICYTRFWLGTNMFETMRYTAPLIATLMYVSS